ncbi:MAG: Crp/Fnr family transcriptional regulator [Desulfotomaculum sp.]|nr:Crp/Fnr family transcriptional regulator [Desulfotomaculum sp.]MCL0080973.1 Crp/Fnr family transcriptional regulator [Peptococcaceae bacterium]
MDKEEPVWECAYCPVRKLTIISDLQGLDLLDFQKNVHKHHVQAKQLIYSEGDDCTALYIVMHGRIKIYYENAEGKEQIVDIIEPGAIFGNISLTAGKKCDVSTEGYGDGMYCSISLTYYRQLVQTKPQVALRLLSMLESQLTKSRKTIRDLSLKRARQRLASIILRIASEENSAAASKDKVAINLPITVQTLAYMSGLTQETASRVMSEFRKNGVTSLKSRHLQILNYAILEEIATSD